MKKNLFNKFKKLIHLEDDNVNNFENYLNKKDFANIKKLIVSGLNNEQKNMYEIFIHKSIQERGIYFLTELFENGIQIYDEYIIDWAKTRSFVELSNEKLEMKNYFKERLSKVYLTVLNFLENRMENLFVSISHSSDPNIILKNEFMSSIKNYVKVIQYAEQKIDNNELKKYIYLLKSYNNKVNNIENFYEEDQVKISTYIELLVTIFTTRKMILNNVIFSDTSKKLVDELYLVYEKCLENKTSFNKYSLEIVQNIKDEQFKKVIENFQKNKNEESLNNNIMLLKNELDNLLATSKNFNKGMLQ